MMGWLEPKASLGIWLILPLVLGACQDGELPGSDPADFLEWDSACIMIAQTPGEVARVPLPWRVSSDPELEIGTDTSPPEGQFFQIGRVGQLPDGRMLIADGSSRELRIFDPAGAFLTAIRGTGEGPGRFTRAPALVHVPGFDSIVAYESGEQRFSAFSVDGDHLHTSASLELPTTTVDTPWGELSLTRITRVVGLLGDQILTLHEVAGAFALPSIPGEEGWQPPTPVEFRLIDPATGASRTVGVFEGERWFETETYQAEGVNSVEAWRLRVPFDPAPAAAVGPDRFYLTLGDKPEFREYDSAGRLRRKVRVDEERRPVTDQDRTAYREHAVRSALNPAQAEMMDHWYRPVEMPDWMPVFRELVVDDLGWIWAKEYEFSQSIPAVWLVFDPEGRGRGVVELPGGLDVHQIGEDFILGVWTDDLGVESVRRYWLSRAEGPAGQ